MILLDGVEGLRYVVYLITGVSVAACVPITWLTVKGYQRFMSPLRGGAISNSYGLLAGLFAVATILLSVFLYNILFNQGTIDKSQNGLLAVLFILQAGMCIVVLDVIIFLSSRYNLSRFLRMLFMLPHLVISSAQFAFLVIIMLPD